MNSSDRITVRVGRDFADVFDKICELKEKGFIDINNNIITSVDPDHRRIVSSSNYDYELDLDLESNDAEMSYEIADDGATWFKAMRYEREVDLGSSSWNTLISAIANNFHEENSYLEFEQAKKTIKTENEDTQLAKIHNLIGTFYSDLTNTSVNKAQNSSYDEIYSVLLSMGIYSTGEPETILARVFFRKVGSKVLPLMHYEAANIDNQVNELVKSMEGKKSRQTNSTSHDEDKNIVYTVLSGLENAINQGKLKDSIIFCGEGDIDIVSKILTYGPKAGTVLSCKNIKVLGIVKCRLYSCEYLIAYNNNPLLKVKFDSTNSLSLSCFKCTYNNQLIVDNRIVKAINEDGSIEFYDKKLIFEEKGFGLTPEDIKDIKENTNFKNHTIKIEHFIRRINEKCVQYRCYNNIIELENGKNKEQYCNNCKYDEIIYKLNNIYYLTRTLDLDHSDVKLMEEKQVGVCEGCGRTFDKKKLTTDNLCPLCSRVDYLESEPKDSSNVYIKYRYLLDPLERTTALLFRKKRVAAEDNQYVVLHVGKKTKIYDKSNITDKGYLHLEVDSKKKNN